LWKPLGNCPVCPPPLKSALNLLKQKDPKATYIGVKKGKGSLYSITERRVPELIQVRGSQPAGDVSHKPGGRLPLFSPARSYPRNP